MNSSFIWIILFNVFSLLFTNLIAQEKSVELDLVRKIPNFQWVDDSKYSYSNGNISSAASERFIVDVETGEEKLLERKRPAERKVRIDLKGNIFLPGDASRSNLIIKEVRCAKFSPDSMLVAYVRENNLYVYDITSRQETQVTTDGSKTILNGLSPWIYNEEIFGRNTEYRAFWWSPDSKNLGFMQFDESYSPVINMIVDTSQHQIVKELKYPLPGDSIPAVRIGIFTNDTKNLIWLQDKRIQDRYFGTPYWSPKSDEFWLQELNRSQDSLFISAYEMKNSRLVRKYKEFQKTWINISQEPRIHFLRKSNRFIIMSDKSGWQHLYLYDWNGKDGQALTSGEWSVDELVAIDEKQGIIFFTAWKENSARLDFYKLNLKDRQVRRLTFGSFNHNISLSPNQKYFITTYSNVETPPRASLLRTTDGKHIRTLADAKGADFSLLNGRGKQSKILRFITPEGFHLPVRINFPAHLDSTKSYGLIVEIYGGPGHRSVYDTFVLGRDPLTDSTRLITAKIDHRGSGHFGKVGQNYMHRNLGEWEIKDYSFVVKALLAKYPFVDSSRVGIKGFSYGGYMAIMAMLKAPDIFKVGLAGGSVTDWHFYDVAYTERYMDSPQENPMGYKTSSTLKYTKNLQGKLLLIQGTFDDNVHMRNTMRLVDQLQEDSKTFDLMFYPRAAHSWFFLQNKQKHSRNLENDYIDKYLVPN